MHGISSIIAVILITVIGISVVSMLYLFISSTQTTLHGAVGQEAEEQQRILGSKIQIIDIKNYTGYVNVTVFNSGSFDAENFIIYIDGVKSEDVVTPQKISPGEIKEIKINNIPVGEHEIKVTTRYASATGKIKVV